MQSNGHNTIGLAKVDIIMISLLWYQKRLHCSVQVLTFFWLSFWKRSHEPSGSHDRFIKTCNAIPPIAQSWPFSGNTRSQREERKTRIGRRAEAEVEPEAGAETEIEETQKAREDRAERIRALILMEVMSCLRHSSWSWPGGWGLAPDHPTQVQIQIWNL